MALKLGVLVLLAATWEHSASLCSPGQQTGAGWGQKETEGKQQEPGKARK